MPDYDIVQSNVRPPFGDLYTEVCEFCLPLEAIGFSAGKALRDSLIDNAAAVDALMDMIEVIENGRTLFSQEDKTSLRRKIDEVACRATANRRYLGLAVDSAKAFLDEAPGARSGLPPKKDISGRFVRSIYNADFVDCASLNGHKNGISQEEFVQRVYRLHPFVNDHIEHLVDQICRNGCANRLRLNKWEVSREQDFRDMDLAMKKIPDGGIQ